MQRTKVGKPSPTVAIAERVLYVLHAIVESTNLTVEDWRNIDAVLYDAALVAREAALVAPTTPKITKTARAYARAWMKKGVKV